MEGGVERSSVVDVVTKTMMDFSLIVKCAYMRVSRARGSGNESSITSLVWPVILYKWSPSRTEEPARSFEEPSGWMCKSMLYASPSCVENNEVRALRKPRKGTKPLEFSIWRVLSKLTVYSTSLKLALVVSGLEHSTQDSEL